MKIQQPHSVLLISIVLFLLVMATGGCKSTKLVGEDEYLLNKLTIECDKSELESKKLLTTMKQKPNRKMLGVYRFHLATYNLFHPKDTSKHPPKLITRIGNVVGEPPVIYEKALHDKSRKNLVNYLHKKGYYNAVVVDTMIVHRRNKKKANLSFKVTAGEAYKINRISYDIIDPFIKDIVFADTVKSKIKSGDVFDMDKLLEERERVNYLIRNSGYYYFSPENIHYYADTILSGNVVNLTMTIKKSFEADRYFLQEIFTRQTLKNVYVYCNFNRGRFAVEKEAYLQTLDTVYYENITLLVDGKLIINPKVILQANYIEPGEVYNVDNVVQTQKHLSSLKQFKGVNIQFSESAEYVKNAWNAENPWLDAHIFLSNTLRQGYTITAEGTNSSGNYGVAGVITYQNQNLFRGAEMFSMKLTGSFQTLAGDDKIGKKQLLNTFEFGPEIRLDVPKLMLPWQSERFIKQHNPATNIGLSFNHQDRHDYTRTLGNASFGYTWYSKNGYFKHSVNPIEYYTVKIFDFNPIFQQQIESLYIRYSFENQLITAMSWDMIFNNQPKNKARDHWYIWTNLETSGNLMRALGSSLGLEKSSSNAYKIFGLEFSQYVKADIDARFYHKIDKRQDLVSRIYLGAGIPYGNSTQGIPFVKKYYIGGANDIRAWRVRTLGPGSYSGGTLFNQIGDMKLVMNLEYRFDIISLLKGALFVDAGNIWALDKSDDRQGALFDPKRFYKEIALGTGLGIRLDVSFMVLRFDFGMPLYDPSFPDGYRWLSKFDKLNLNDFTLNFGIGYPF